MFIPALIGCKKKERLTASTYTFKISPSASTVVKNNTLTLTAKGLSSAGDISVNPTWSCTGACTATDLSTTFGSAITFTASTLGDAVVTAVFDGQTATSQIAVVTYISNANTYDVYRDLGLPSGSNVLSDIFVGGGLSLNELSTGYTPEGTKYERASSVLTGAFWGVTLDKNNTGLKQDLSTFSGGHLKFALRLVDRIIGAGETLRIDVVDSPGSTASVTLSSTYGFDRTSTDWQEISIPLSLYFPGVDETQIKVPFALVATAIPSTLTVDVDAVRWDKN